MTSSYSHLAFAIDILKLLSVRPRKREELAEQLSDTLNQSGKSIDDINQKLTRTIRKLRDCGFEINSAPNRPYELVESNFPVILAPQQREALAMAAYILDDMGFSVQASQLLRIGNLSEPIQPTLAKVSFSPPVDYSEANLEKTVQHLQQRFQKQCRYSIRYRSSQGIERNWDCDRSELRLHDGVLYLFAFIPDFKPPNNLPRLKCDRNMAFRVDRILTVRAASDIPWCTLRFQSEKIRYRMSGPLATYQPRRTNEQEVHRDPDNRFVDIETEEDYWFWFRQRLLRYGANARLLDPPWLAQRIKQELQEAYHNYEGVEYSHDNE